MAFNPNSMTFDQGLKRIADAYNQAGTKMGGKVVTSKDPDITKVSLALAVSNVPNGFKKWQLPVHLGKASQFFISTGAPDVEVPLHSHDEGDGIRVIISGSILYNGTELCEGDWMFIPKGNKYQFKVGPRGVTQFYCYECCCA